VKFVQIIGIFLKSQKKTRQNRSYNFEVQSVKVNCQSQNKKVLVPNWHIHNPANFLKIWSGYVDEALINYIGLLWGLCLL
jgi:hypothetical protein